jgi:hypothetical protein
VALAGVRRLAPASLVLALCLGPVRAVGGSNDGQSLEYAVKAALLLNFAKFTDWPSASPQARRPYVTICVLGRDPFGPVLEQTLTGRSVGGRPLVVKRYDTSEGCASCNVVFVTSGAGRLQQDLRALADEPALTVGETPGFASRGGVIGLFVEGGFVRFEVNLAAASRARLVLSSKLLGLARAVARRPEQGPRP